MASLLSKIASFARTPAGQRALRTATTKAQELSKDPRTKDKVAQVRERIQGRGDTTSPTTPTSPTPGGPASDGGPERPDDRPTDTTGRRP